MSLTSGDSRRLDVLRVALLIIAGLGHGLWIVSLLANWGQPELLRRDFIVLHHAAHAAPEALYVARAFPFLHPPPVAALARLLAPLSPLGIYAGVLLGNGLSFVVLLRGLFRLRPSHTHRDVLVLAALASAPWLLQLLLGQPAALWPMLWLVGLLVSKRRPLLAGLVWSLTGLKPLFLGGPLLLAAIRGRRALLGVALGLVVLFLVSLPLGLEVWPAWLGALSSGSAAVAAEGFPLFKQHTLRAALLWLRVPGAGAVAGLLALALGGWTAREVWRRRADGYGCLSVLALATVALGPYLYFYDAFLLILPAGRLWLQPGRSRTRSALLAAALFLLQPVVYFGLQTGAPFGLITAAWLVSELLAPVTDGHALGSAVPAPTGAT